MMDEQQFQNRCDKAMDDLYRALLQAADDHDFDVDQNAGTVTVEFEEPRAKFVVSPNSPVRQIWVSALTKSFKLDWNDAAETFVLSETGASLRALMADVITRQLGESVEL
jgi:iron donor protein CyaY